MRRLKELLLFTTILLLLASCQSIQVEPDISLDIGIGEVEAGGTLPLSAFITLPPGITSYSLDWETTGGKIQKTRVENAVDFKAPPVEGDTEITVTYADEELTLSDTKTVKVLKAGALAPVAEILITVDTNTLQHIYVDENAPDESFTPPLRIKGTFHYTPDTMQAASGGNWQNYEMYDDGTHGDVAADDGIWSIRMVFEKTSEKVYFAFDEGSSYRVQWESGLAWKLKAAWIDLDEFPNDKSNPAFIPNKDQQLIWDAAMAEEGGIK